MSLSSFLEEEYVALIKRTLTLIALCHDFFYTCTGTGPLCLENIQKFSILSPLRISFPHECSSSLAIVMFTFHSTIQMVNFNLAMFFFIHIDIRPTGSQEYSKVFNIISPWNFLSLWMLIFASLGNIYISFHHLDMVE